MIAASLRSKGAE